MRSHEFHRGAARLSTNERELMAVQRVVATSHRHRERTASVEGVVCSSPTGLEVARIWSKDGMPSKMESNKDGACHVRTVFLPMEQWNDSQFKTAALF